MGEQLDFNTYLFISPSKISIFVNKNFETQNIFFKELKIKNDLNKLNFEFIENFLHENIFKIEKLLNDFVKNIYLIIDSSNFLINQMSIKENNYGKQLTQNNLKHLLNMSKDQCIKTLEDNKIIHMIIDNYQIDKKNYPFFPDNISCENFSLDITFILLSNKIIKDLELILKRYQISIIKILNASYLLEFFKKNERDIFLMAKKMIDGHNKNEVHLIPKTQKNSGFLEKFFHFFS